MTIEDVIARRRTERATLIESARRFAVSLDPSLAVDAVVVFGSVARGDFNLWSDVDVLVVARMAPERFLDRLDALGQPPPRIEPIVWTPAEWRAQVRRRNPIATECVESGVWLVGSPAALAR